MELSIIIVNYNVKHFLEQCLISVYSALKDIDAEVFVVDNASSDNSCAMVKQRFPMVKLVENENNVGFSKANNQAIVQATGKYILLLNPDTVVQEDTFVKCIQFMNSHPEAGSLTVKMIDGKGNYLPESKRGFPSPWVSFFKIFGLTYLFPKSKIFARYYLGHLDKDSTHQIDILPGAFMFIRKDALDKAGLLDEQFFMYGEDIDLSYRITLAGYQNFYYPDCQIIHYKGESTKKGSLNYVVVFYKAMILFAEKHFKSRNINVFIILINLAIYFRAFLSILKRIVKLLWLPLADISIIAIGIKVILPLWEQYRFQNTNVYPEKYVLILFAFYISTWIFSLWINGAYDKPQKLLASSKGVITGTIIILAVYSILPNYMRFSRAIILITSAWSLISVQGLRLILAKAFPKLIINKTLTKRVAVVGNTDEAEKIKLILNNSGIKYNYIGNYSAINHISDFSIERLEEYVRINDIDEIIFGTQEVSMSNIVSSMLFLSSLGKEYKIAPHERTFIIGSNSIETNGELYSLEIKAIGTPASKRSKRLFDVLASIILLIFWPLLFVLLKNPFESLLSTIKVLFGTRTWIGYNNDINQNVTLPSVKRCIYAFNLNESNKASDLDENLYYAKNYSVNLDLVTLLKNILRKSI
ncbi:MAG: glycosyltransferase [Bacteroidales bacterium]